MFYTAIVTREEEHWLVEFPEAPGCQTFGDDEADARSMAEDALMGWLRASLQVGHAVTPPSSRALEVPQGVVAVWQVQVPARLAVAVQVRWARTQANLTQAELAARLAVSQQQVAKWERESNVSVDTLERIAVALGRHLEVSL